MILNQFRNAFSKKKSFRTFADSLQTGLETIHHCVPALFRREADNKALLSKESEMVDTTQTLPFLFVALPRFVLLFSFLNRHGGCYESGKEAARARACARKGCARDADQATAFIHATRS